MACFFNLESIRKKQLDREKKLDLQITISKDICPDIINKYLLDRRKINRYDFDEIYNTSFWNKCNVIEYNIISIDNHIDLMNSLFEKYGVCDGLQEYYHSYK